MSTYVIGDIQGCFADLQALLARIAFDPARDRLLLVGDLVNRGPQSLEVLRWARDTPAVTTVLGNHDVHLLARLAGISAAKRRDTLDEVLAAADRDALGVWLRTRPMIHEDGEHLVVHGGVHPSWTLDETRALARAIEATLAGDDWHALLSASRKSGLQWRAGSTGLDRLARAMVVMLNIRCVDERGEMLDFSGEPADAPPGAVPWFRRLDPSFSGTRVVFGHWSALGLVREAGYLATDTGCVWGRSLTAVRLDDDAVIQVPRN